MEFGYCILNDNGLHTKVDWKFYYKLHTENTTIATTTSNLYALYLTECDVFGYSSHINIIVEDSNAKSILLAGFSIFGFVTDLEIDMLSFLWNVVELTPEKTFCCCCCCFCIHDTYTCISILEISHDLGFISLKLCKSKCRQTIHIKKYEKHYSNNKMMMNQQKQHITWPNNIISI